MIEELELIVKELNLKFGSESYDIRCRIVELIEKQKENEKKVFKRDQLGAN